MKILTRTITAGFVVAIMMSSCNDALKQDGGEASENLKEAGNDLKEGAIATNETAESVAISQWETFKKESDSTIAGMERQLTDLTEKIAKAGTREKEKLQNNLNKTSEKLKALKEKLQQRNAAFENDKNNFDTTVVSKYQSFENEFKHDMNELGTAFNDLFKDNVK